jgi:hypothetical protein
MISAAFSSLFKKYLSNRLTALSKPEYKARWRLIQSFCSTGFAVCGLGFKQLTGKFSRFF